MTRAEKNIWQSTAAFEPLWDDQNGHEPIVVSVGEVVYQIVGVRQL